MITPGSVSRRGFLARAFGTLCAAPAIGALIVNGNSSDRKFLEKRMVEKPDPLRYHSAITSSEGSIILLLTGALNDKRTMTPREAKYIVTGKL